ncbi:uncharacterized protein G2W53_030739 [Senna tora]|uniref:RNase H type-1 domain-containing protein n=1 Tax=Senna tora TaxID=362788 RepID=A0A834WB36_9FABA|nr:uncharacterized protein G2W53_030739 [Senna tora]
MLSLSMLDGNLLLWIGSNLTLMDLRLETLALLALLAVVALLEIIGVNGWVDFTLSLAVIQPLIEAIELINKAKNMGFTCNRVTGRIFKLASEFGKVLFSHCFREANICADWLTNFSLSFRIGVIELSSPPTDLLKLIARDKIGLTSCRVGPVRFVWTLKGSSSTIPHQHQPSNSNILQRPMASDSPSNSHFPMSQYSSSYSSSSSSSSSTIPMMLETSSSNRTLHHTRSRFSSPPSDQPSYHYHLPSCTHFRLSTSSPLSHSLRSSSSPPDLSEKARSLTLACSAPSPSSPFGLSQSLGFLT